MILLIRRLWDLIAVSLVFLLSWSMTDEARMIVGRSIAEAMSKHETTPVSSGGAGEGTNG